MKESNTQNTMPVLPEGFKRQMRDLIGDESNLLFAALNSERPLSLRLNLRKLTNPASAYPGMARVSWCDSGYYLPKAEYPTLGKVAPIGRPSFTLHPLLHAGAFYVQEASSMIYQQAVAKILEIEGERKGWDAPRILDMCAAPGGKTTAIINALPDEAAVIANEYVGKRAVILRENLQKWGFPNVAVTNSDSSLFAQSPEAFDIVAVDAPCSGEGMMRREAEARRQWSTALVEQCAELQREILRNAVDALRPGGWLIYSTCTFNAEENERNSEFIASLPGMTHHRLRLEGVPEESYTVSVSLSSIAPGIRFMPHITRGEGLFINFFRKGGERGERGERGYTRERGYIGERGKSGNEKGKKGKKGKDDSSLLNEVRQWIDSFVREEYTLQAVNNTIVAVPANLKALTDTLAQDLRYISMGVDMAETKGKNLIPLTPLALSSISADSFPSAQLTQEEALQYLRGDAIVLPTDAPKGFVTICYQDHPLGFAKNIGNRANNLYPSPWRIKKL